MQNWLATSFRRCPPSRLMTEPFSIQSVIAHWQTRVAFEIRTRKFSLLDVVRAADLRGDLAPLIRESQQAQACERWAEQEGRDPDMEAVEAMIDEFRYARSLVTVEETERWLDDFGLTVDELSDHFVRRYWVAEWSRRGTKPLIETDTGAPAWPTDLLISGNFLRLARQLAREAACAGQHDPPSASLSQELLDDFRSRRGLDEAGYQSWRNGWHLTDEAVVTLLSVQRHFERHQREILSPLRRAGVLAEQRTALVRVELAAVQFDTAAAAHEAYLCVTADGMSLEDVAVETGFPLRQENALVRQFPEAWHLPLLGALPGRTLPPLPNRDTYDLCRVLGHAEPNLDDPAVIAELDALLMERQFGQLEAREVCWHINGETGA